MPRTPHGWTITADELRAWTLHEDEDVLVVNKPAHVVCHPSKHGPWSSVAGAAREYLGVAKVHLPVRLDRETSGVVVIAKKEQAGRRLHNAVTRRRIRKRYLAVLTGGLTESRVVDAPLGRDPEAEYVIRQAIVRDGGRAAVTRFEPVAQGGGFTLARVFPETGRLHQIRVHAAAMGHAVVGDKLYGPDPAFMLEFVRNGFTDDMRAKLILDRQALHAEELVFELGNEEVRFIAPLTPDLSAFCSSHFPSSIY